MDHFGHLVALVIDIRYQHFLLIYHTPFACQQKMLIAMKPSQCRAARALLDWTQPQLATAAGLGLSTVVDFEKERRAVSAEATAAMRAALEAAGIEFINGTGVKMARP
ncbi:helix-turn-helix domain-containing protein [Sinorhizobium fredii]|nr:helix-turn-helix transcriptional regulator [Sinorhizobium fredii]